MTTKEQFLKDYHDFLELPRTSSEMDEFLSNSLDRYLGSYRDYVLERVGNRTCQNPISDYFRGFNSCFDELKDTIEWDKANNVQVPLE